MSHAVATTSETTVLERLASQPVDAPAFVAELRRAGRDRILEAGLPTPRREAWRFTNLKRIAETVFEPAPAATADPGPWAVDGAHLAVMVNGRFAPGLSRLAELPDGVTVGSLAQAWRDRPELVKRHLGRRVQLDDHPVAALATAAFVDGVMVHVARGVAVDEPIQVLHVAVGCDAPVAAAPRLLVIAEATSQATVVEQYVGVGGGTLTLPVTELELAPGAVLRHVRLQEEARNTDHVALQTAFLERDAQLESVAVNLGGLLFRADVDAVLAGEGAHAAIDGLYLVEGDQHSDTQLRVRHAAPHCTSHELYKGILDGSARSVFNGRIVVDPGAQKTDAIQANRNLLLSDGALAFSNPQLEIFADDVRCTHGSTVGRLDEDAVFYLRSRGLDRAAAESLLTWAFASELVQRIPVDPVRERLERFLFERLPQGEVVQEAV